VKGILGLIGSNLDSRLTVPLIPRQSAGRLAPNQSAALLTSFALNPVLQSRTCCPSYRAHSLTMDSVSPWSINCDGLLKQKHPTECILWHICSKPGLWNQQRRPLVGNGSVNTLITRQWLINRYVIATTVANATIGELWERCLPCGTPRGYITRGGYKNVTIMQPFQGVRTLFSHLKHTPTRRTTGHCLGTFKNGYKDICFLPPPP
jgi:hypothetical protein